ncbi:MAG: PPC domain-containing protein [Candidatus Bathycorpusculaceae bacterium]
MEFTVKRKWFAITFAAIILPLSLLTTLKLRGIIPEPITPETITLEPVTLQIERPLDWMYLREMVNGIYSNNGIRVNLSVHTSDYWENPSPGMPPFFGRDAITLLSYVNVTVERGFITYLVVRYHPMDANATIILNREFLIMENGTVKHLKSMGSDLSEAYVAAEASNTPSSLFIQSHWIFEDEDDEHKLQITLEVLHFNGTVYEKMAIPTILYMWPDAGETIETARTLNPGAYIGSLYYVYDLYDFYKVTLRWGETINVSITPRTVLDFTPDYDLYLYDPNGQLRASSCTLGDLPITEHITFTADSNGVWYIKIQGSRTYSHAFPYLLNITVFSGW